MLLQLTFCIYCISHRTKSCILILYHFNWQYILFYSKIVIAYEYHIFNPTIIDGHIGLFLTQILRAMFFALNRILRIFLQHSNLISHGYIFRLIFMDHEVILLLFFSYVIFEIKSKGAIPQEYNKRHFKIVWNKLFLNFCDLPQTWNTFAWPHN